MRKAIESAQALYRRDGPLVRDRLAVAVGVALTLLAVKTPWSSMPRPVILVAGLVASAALWWRRRRPVATTLVGTAVFVLSGNPWPVAVGLSTTAAGRRDRALWAITSLVGVGFALPVMIDLGRFDLRTLVSGVAEAGVVAAIGCYLGVRQQLLVSLRDRAERAEAERELRDVEARAAERARIAREMHDVLAHKVSLIALHAGALEVNPGAGQSRVEEVAGVIRATARQTLEELRGVLGVLRADGRDGAAAGELDGLAPQPQAADIERLVESSCAAGVPAELRGDVPELPGATARAAYRVVQEALTNVHKHAHGAPAVVSVTGDERAGVTVTVTNGRSAATGSSLPGSGAGLVGLGERARLAGGTLCFGPRPEGGWRLEAWLPWPPPAEADLDVDVDAAPRPVSGQTKP